MRSDLGGPASVEASNREEPRRDDVAWRRRAYGAAARRAEDVCVCGDGRWEQEKRRQTALCVALELAVAICLGCMNLEGWSGVRARAKTNGEPATRTRWFGELPGETTSQEAAMRLLEKRSETAALLPGKNE